MYAVLSIAGSDSCCGAGVQADIKTLSAIGVYGLTAVTAVTAQNTLGVQAVFPLPADMVRAQLESVCGDIRPCAVKIGMLPDAQCVRAVSGAIRRYALEHIVIDTVFSASAGTVLQPEAAMRAAAEELYPLAELLTPNIPEAEQLSGMRITADAGCEAAARRIGERWGCAVLIKGGHRESGADDVLYTANGTCRWFRAQKQPNPHTHGTGCTFSSAIAGYLAQGCAVEQAVRRAKEFITGAVADGFAIGHGRGPLNHFYSFYPSTQGE